LPLSEEEERMMVETLVEELRGNFGEAVKEGCVRFAGADEG
jgi:hypothetical protein